MKKIIAITMMAMMILCIFAGCSENKTEANTPEENPEVTEPVEETPNDPASDIPNAKGFPEMSWPTFGAATKIPAPDWSSNGEILVDSEITFWVQVGYSTVDNYNDYMKACQEAGFTKDYYSIANYMYYGANSDGYAIQLTYNEYDHYIAIQVTANAADWDKWWLEDEENT